MTSYTQTLLIAAEPDYYQDIIPVSKNQTFKFRFETVYSNKTAKLYKFTWKIRSCSLNMIL